MEAGRPFLLTKVGNAWQVETDHGIVSTPFEDRAKQVAAINLGDHASVRAGIEGLSFCTGEPAVGKMRLACLGKLGGP